MSSDSDSDSYCDSDSYTGPSYDPELVKAVAECNGITDLTDEAAKFLAENVTSLLNHLIQDSGKFMHHSRRQKLTCADVDNALQHFEPFYEFLPHGEIPLSFLQDQTDMSEPTSDIYEPISDNTESASDMWELISNMSERMSDVWEPMSDRSEPMSDNPEPMSDNPEPMSDNPEPMSDKWETLSEMAESMSDKSEPMSEMAEPMSDKSEPMSEMAEPMSDKSEPMSEMAEPMSDKSEPMSEMAEPMSDKSEPSEPMSEMAEPMSDKSEPMSEMAEPMSDKSEPMSEMAEPMSDKLEPMSEMAEPMSDKSEPVNDIAESTSDESDTISYKSEQASDESETLTYKSEQASDESETISYKSEQVGDDSETISYQSEQVSDDSETISDLPVKLRREISIRAHWLTDPAPEHLHKIASIHSITKPSTTSRKSTVENSYKMKRAENVFVKQLASHELSVEQQIFFKVLTEACVGSDEPRRIEALQCLATDPGLHEMLPRISAFISEGVKVNVIEHNLAILIYLMRMVKAILENQTVYIEKYLHELIPSVVTCLVSKQISMETDNHWPLRDFAAKLLAQICKNYSTPSNNIKLRVIRVLATALSDTTTYITSLYGIVSGLTSIGPEVVKVFVYPKLKLLANQIDIYYDTDRTAVAHLLNALMRIIPLIIVAIRPPPDNYENFKATYGSLGPILYSAVVKARAALRAHLGPTEKK